ncbi:hypothetical protein H5410_061454 [Solanum commersonii]|uniref:Uncharacterized protein n=1 Tax=Solanum commersonii TaxID=4109 RepID=A0A9J5W976_SOLCO|nr:hypothetical protein H5410_061454 [Solanum commersonii]
MVMFHPTSYLETPRAELSIYRFQSPLHKWTHPNKDYKLIWILYSWRPIRISSRKPEKQHKFILLYQDGLSLFYMLFFSLSRLVY